MSYQSVSEEMRRLAGSRGWSDDDFRSEYQSILVWALRKWPKSPRAWLQFQGELLFWKLYLAEQYGVFPGFDPEPMESACLAVGQVEVDETAPDHVPLNPLGVSLIMANPTLYSLLAPRSTPTPTWQRQNQNNMQPYQTPAPYIQPQVSPTPSLPGQPQYVSQTSREQAKLFTRTGELKPCFSFMNTGVCKYGPGCRYDHVTINQSSVVPSQAQTPIHNSMQQHPPPYSPVQRGQTPNHNQTQQPDRLPGAVEHALRIRISDGTGHMQANTESEKPCFRFMRTGQCEFGDMCRYTHVPGLCVDFFGTGNCKLGERCSYSHEVPPGYDGFKENKWATGESTPRGSLPVNFGSTSGHSQNQTSVQNHIPQQSVAQFQEQPQVAGGVNYMHGSNGQWQPCFSFMRDGTCKRAECKFDHAKGYCFFFFKVGKCDAGNTCRFSHVPPQGYSYSSSAVTQPTRGDIATQAKGSIASSFGPANRQPQDRPGRLHPAQLGNMSSASRQSQQLAPGQHPTSAVAMLGPPPQLNSGGGLIRSQEKAAGNGSAGPASRRSQNQARGHLLQPAPAGATSRSNGSVVSTARHSKNSNAGVPSSESRQSVAPTTTHLTPAIVDANPNDSQSPKQDSSEAEAPQLKLASPADNPWKSFFAPYPESGIPPFATIFVHTNTPAALQGPEGKYLKEFQAQARFPSIAVRFERTSDERMPFIAWLEPQSQSGTSKFVLESSLYSELCRMHKTLLVYSRLDAEFLPPFNWFLKQYGKERFEYPKEVIYNHEVILFEGRIEVPKNLTMPGLQSQGARRAESDGEGRRRSRSPDRGEGAERWNFRDRKVGKYKCG